MTFNLKVYTKDRIYRKIKQYPGQSRLLVWDADRAEYGPPIRGKNIQARKTILVNGKKIIKKEFFNSSEEAHLWQISKNEVVEPVKAITVEAELFPALIERWKLFHYPKVKSGTQIRYDGLLKRAFPYWSTYAVSDIVPSDIDKWLEWLRTQPGRSTRKSFEDELDLLSVIMNYVEEFDDSNKFKSPIKKRHYENAIVRKERKSNRKMTEEEFLQFRDRIGKGAYGENMFHLVTLQFYQALRVSEVCALGWEDVHFAANPAESYIEISKHIQWKRVKGAKPELENGFKNSEALGGSKILFLHPESYRSLQALQNQRAGLIFHDSGQPYTYRQLQYQYNEALTTLGLPFKSTHILRHGGSTHYMNLFPDYALNQMLLGNTTLDSTKVYAQRNGAALKEMNAKIWNTESQTPN